MVRSKRRRAINTDTDPMSGTSNLVDAMLVLAVGFLIFVVMSWNMQSIIFSDASQDEKNNMMEKMKSATNLDQGEELADTPNVTESSGKGYTEMGKVYKDPNTGKLIMVEG